MSGEIPADQQAPSSSRLGTIGLGLWQYGRNAALSAAEYVTPVLTESQFIEKGVLTPEEFVAAGDMLVLRCPTWQWQAGDPTKARPFLPPNKQFLLTRNVPCQRRACTLSNGADDEMAVMMGAADGGEEEEWTATHNSLAAKAVKDEEIMDLGGSSKPSAAKPAAGAVDVSDELAGLSVGGGASSAAAAAEAGLEDMGAIEADDPSALEDEDFDTLGDEAIVKTRTYAAT